MSKTAQYLAIIALIILVGVMVHFTYQKNKDTKERNEILKYNSYLVLTESNDRVIIDETFEISDKLEKSFSLSYIEILDSNSYIKIREIVNFDEDNNVEIVVRKFSLRVDKN